MASRIPAGEDEALRIFEALLYEVKRNGSKDIS